MNPGFDMLVSWTFDGQLPSMKNSRRLVRNRATGRPMFIKSEEAQAYERAFLQALPQAKRIGYSGDVALRAHVWYQSRRSDLDIEFLKDLLQKGGIILNDRQVTMMFAKKGLDRERPRVVFTLYVAPSVPLESPPQASRKKKPRGPKPAGLSG